MHIDSEYEDDSDLEAFDDQKQIQELQNLNLNPDMMFDQAQEIKQKALKQPPKETVKVQPNSAMKLRAQNAAKFFEKVKLTALIHIRKSINYAQQVKTIRQTKLSSILSMLTSQQIQMYSQLKSHPPSTLNIDKLLSFMKEVKVVLDSKDRPYEMNTIFWLLCDALEVSCRKLNFFELGNNAQQPFYNLNYDEPNKKRKSKSSTIDLMKNRINRQIFEEQLSNSEAFVDLNDFQFHMPVSQSNIVPQKQKQKNKGLAEKRNKNNIQRKNFRNNSFEIFSVVDDQWRLVNVEILELEEVAEFKLDVLNDLNIVGFYSTRLLHFKQQYRPLAQLRPLKELQIRDQTLVFADSLLNISKRKRRVSCKFILRDIFNVAAYRKPYELLTQHQAYVQIKTDAIEQELLEARFPENPKEMNESEYLTVPSRQGKYKMLSDTAQPLGKEFNEEKVYLKRDLISITTRNGWIEAGRRVMFGQEPIKKTENRNKNHIKLYRYEQTVPFSFQFDQEGDIIMDDDYNDVCLPPEFQLPPGMSIINKRIEFICRKHGFKYYKAIQGFAKAGGRDVPNFIGYIVYEKDVEEILKLHEERQASFLAKKEERREEDCIKMWKQLFKSIKLHQHFCQ